MAASYQLPYGVPQPQRSSRAQTTKHPSSKAGSHHRRRGAGMPQICDGAAGEEEEEEGAAARLEKPETKWVQAEAASL